VSIARGWWRAHAGAPQSQPPSKTEQYRAAAQRLNIEYLPVYEVNGTNEAVRRFGLEQETDVCHLARICSQIPSSVFDAKTLDGIDPTGQRQPTNSWRIVIEPTDIDPDIPRQRHVALGARIIVERQDDGTFDVTMTWTLAAPIDPTHKRRSKATALPNETMAVTFIQQLKAWGADRWLNESMRLSMRRVRTNANIMAQTVLSSERASSSASSSEKSDERNVRTRSMKTGSSKDGSSSATGGQARTGTSSSARPAHIATSSSGSFSATGGTSISGQTDPPFAMNSPQRRRGSASQPDIRH
jgi:hypothetical protein